MAHKKNAPKHLQRLLQVSMMLMIVVSVGFYGMQLLTSHADTAAYYSCNGGDTLSGSTCTHTSTYTGTYHASQPYCYENSSDTYLSITNSCSYPATATTTYTCNSGDSGGGTSSTCYHVYDKPASGCGSDINYFYSKCEHVYTGTAHTTYSCRNSSDYMNTQYHNCSYTASSTTPYYSCNNGDSLNGSTCTHTTTYAATYHPATTTSITGTSSSGTTTTGTTTKKVTTTTKSTSTPVTITPAQPPSAPADFKAEVISSKIVELTWTAGQAAAGVKDYELERSVDNATWESVATISNTSYTDTSTDFATKYYYRIHETDNSGANSDYATTDVTTGKFSSTGSTIRSDDKVVTVSIPSGSFDRGVSCSITSSVGDLPTVPTKLLLVGPYDILCVADDGSIIGNFKKPLTVTMDLSGVGSGYGAVTAKLFDDSSENDAKSTYDAKAHKISFELTSDKSFAIYGKKQGSAGKEIFIILLLLVAGGGGAFYLRRYWAGRQTAAPEIALSNTAVPAMMPAAAVVAGAMPPPAASAENIFEQAVNKPNCTHLSMAHQVQPQSSGCAECTAEHKHWKGLRICLTCGHVGCSDDSNEQHARKHHEQTGHPLIYEYGNPGGDSIGWCYIDQTYI